MQGFESDTVSTMIIEKGCTGNVSGIITKIAIRGLIYNYLIVCCLCTDTIAKVMYPTIFHPAMG